MKLARPSRRSAPETIIALIDVVFFLLVFFLLIGRMDATAPFELTPPTARHGADMPGGGATVAISATGVLALDGTETREEALLEKLQARAAETPELSVRLNADRNTPLRTVLPLAERLQAAGLTRVQLVVTPEQP